MSTKPSLKPQHAAKFEYNSAKAEVWYYEERGHIEFHVEPLISDGRQVIFRIPRYRLERSLRRMRRRT